MSLIEKVSKAAKILKGVAQSTSSSNLELEREHTFSVVVIHLTAITTELLDYLFHSIRDISSVCWS